jgi:hypothetical protein
MTMTLCTLWLLRYDIEGRRRAAFGRRHYVREAVWALLLALLSIGGRP